MCIGSVSGYDHEEGRLEAGFPGIRPEGSVRLRGVLLKDDFLGTAWMVDPLKFDGLLRRVLVSDAADAAPETIAFSGSPRDNQMSGVVEELLLQPSDDRSL
jgi:hypothetical protein